MLCMMYDRVCLSAIISSDVIMVTCCSKYLFFKLQTSLLTSTASESCVQSVVGFVRDVRPAAFAARGLWGEM